MALIKVRDWNPTDGGKVAQAVVWAGRGSDGDAYVLDVDEDTGGIPFSGEFVIDFTPVLDTIPGSLVAGVVFDSFAVDESAPTQSVYTFRLNGVLKATTTIVWANSDKEVPVSGSTVKAGA